MDVDLLKVVWNGMDMEMDPYVDPYMDFVGWIRTLDRLELGYLTNRSIRIGASGLQIGID